MLLLCQGIYAQTDPECPVTKIVNEIPIISGTYDASYNVVSRGIVGGNDPSVKMHGGNHVLMNPGFEVKSGALFHAYIESCTVLCDETIPPCEGAPCPMPAFERDSRGNEYVPNQIVVTLPEDVQVDLMKEFEIKAYLDGIVTVAPAESTLRKCLCDQNIFIYESNVEIFEEGTIGQANSGAGPNDEGEVYGINYYVEPDFTDQTTATNGSPGQAGYVQQLENISNNNTSKIVAFLDTGIDPYLLPDDILLQQPSTCFGNQDIYGWNFVDDNNNIFDNRGHGTAVVLAYLNALDELGVNTADQAILPIKVLDDCGRGTIFSVVCGMYYAKSKGAKLLNNSWGLYFNEIQLQKAVIDLSSVGIRMSCSAGNLSKDLGITEHFPSGYAHPYQQLKPDMTTMPGAPISSMFEVGGLCHNIMDTNSGPTVPLWPQSNYRGSMFVEPAINVEELINDTSEIPIIPSISCGISGTSFAAPQITAAIIWHCTEFGFPPLQSDLVGLSKNVSTTNNHFSFMLNNP